MDSRRNSLTYWFPRIAEAELDIPYPRTSILAVGLGHDYWQYITKPFPKALDQKILESASLIGYPLFMRTDQLSGKHSWNRTCYVKQEDDLIPQLHTLLEESACAGVLGLPVSAFVFREFIELDWKFKAFEGMPVAKERRYFVNDGEVLCHHPYWIEDAVAQSLDWRYELLDDLKKQGRKPKNYSEEDLPPRTWRATLQELNTESVDEVKLLSDYAERIAKIIDGYWSVDFAHAKDGRWFFIDAAVGFDSWHPECARALKRENKGG